MDDVSAARRIAEELRPGIERTSLRGPAEAKRILRHGRAQLALQKVELLSYVIGDDLASKCAFEARVERLRAERPRGQTA